MEEINMFELHLSPAEKLFNKNNLEAPEYSRTYTFFTKKQKILGELIAHDDTMIVVGNAWVSDHSDEKGCYKDSVLCKINDIQKINTQQDFEFEIGQPYRAELYFHNNKTDRPTSWISCYYRGQTHSGKIMVSVIGDKAKVMILKKTDIKGFFQLTIDDAQKIEDEGNNAED